MATIRERVLGKGHSPERPLEAHMPSPSEWMDAIRYTNSTRSSGSGTTAHLSRHGVTGDDILMGNEEAISNETRALYATSPIHIVNDDVIDDVMPDRAPPPFPVPELRPEETRHRHASRTLIIFDEAGNRDIMRITETDFQRLRSWARHDRRGFLQAFEVPA